MLTLLQWMVIFDQSMKRELACWGDGRKNWPSKLHIEHLSRLCCHVERLQMLWMLAKSLCQVAS